MGTLWENSPILAAIRAYVDDLYNGNVRAAARSFGVKYETVYNWYNGKRMPRLDSLGNTLEMLKASGKLKDSNQAFEAPSNSSQTEKQNDAPERGQVQKDALSRFIKEGKLRVLDDFEFVPRATAIAGCGESLQTEEGLASLYAFRRDFLSRQGIQAENALMMYVSGDSMEPTIMNNDTILIDKTDITPKDGHIYVLSLGDALMVKRLQKIANGWLLRSDNEKYAPVSVQGQELDQMRIYGRVRWYSRVI